MTVTEEFAAPVAEPGRPAVVARDVFCLYPVPDGTVAALRGLSLTVMPGERLLVHGPNGSGKTTLLRVLMGMQSPSAGTVEVAGTDLSGADERTVSALRRTSLGVVDQHAARTLRPELSVVQNVALQSRVAGLSKTEAAGRAHDLLTQLGLAQLASRAPYTLSGGEAQRVAVCAAVAHGPSIVLADEPTGELDRDNADAVYDLLRAAVDLAGAALVLVTHDASAARIATRVVRIRDGRISETWSPDSPEQESLVVDDRGWLRLPVALRAAVGAERAVRAEEVDGTIVLRGIDQPVAKARPSAPRVGTTMHSGDQALARVDSVVLSRGDRTIFDGLSLDVNPSRLTVVEGRSGAGKSSLLRLLLGLADPESGSVEIAGRKLGPLNRSSRADVRREFTSFAGQIAALVEALTIDENLELAQAGRRTDAGGLVDDAVEALGLVPLRGRPVRLLSGGERQRVAVARCLASQRALIVLDEPTSQQDEAHAELVADALRAASRRGIAVLVATHDPVLIARADERLTLS